MITTIAGLQCICPSNRITTKDVASVYEEKYGRGDSQKQQFIKSLLTDLRIDSRYLSVVPRQEGSNDWTPFLEGRDSSVIEGHSTTRVPSITNATIEKRFDAFLEEASRLVPEAARLALEEASMDASQITQVYFVSNTGFSVPSMECVLFNELNLPPTAGFYNVMGMGCGGGIASLRLAHDYCKGNPSGAVLLIVVDLSSVHTTFNDKSKLDIILHAIFADGCAAAVLHHTEQPVEGKLNICGGFSEHIPGTKDGIDLSIDAQSVKCLLSPKLPQYVLGSVSQVVTRAFSRLGFGSAEDVKNVDLWAIHPGGRKIVEACQTSLHLSDDDLEHTWEVMREHGNMLAPSALFVLRRMLDAAQRDKAAAKRSELGVSISFSPGVRVEGIIFKLEHGPDSGKPASAMAMVKALRPWSFPIMLLPFLTTWGSMWSAGQTVEHKTGTALLALTSLATFALCNLVNTLYDFLSGADTEASADDRTLIDGILTVTQIRSMVGSTVVLTLLLAALTHLALSGTAVAGVVTGQLLLNVFLAWAYTAPPFNFKGRGLGDVMHLLVFGPAMFWLALASATGAWPRLADLSICLPHCLLAEGILYANNARDVLEDARVGIHTVAQRLSHAANSAVYAALVLGSFLAAAGIVLAGSSPAFLLALVKLPTAFELVKDFRQQTFFKLPQRTALCLMQSSAMVLVGMVLLAPVMP